MHTILSLISQKILTYKENGVLTVCYALLLEFLFIGYIIFAGLFTLETLLPTFIITRVNLMFFFWCLLIGSITLSFIGHIIDVRFSLETRKYRVLLWIASFWALSIFLLSLLHFPPLSIFFILALIFLIAFSFWNILFQK